MRLERALAGVPEHRSEMAFRQELEWTAKRLIPLAKTRRGETRTQDSVVLE
jgi:hypothetical protein